MWVKNRDRIINTGFSVTKAGVSVLIMPIIFTVGCISFITVSVLHATNIIYEAVRKRNEAQDKNLSSN